MSGRGCGNGVNAEGIAARVVEVVDDDDEDIVVIVLVRRTEVADVAATVDLLNVFDASVEAATEAVGMYSVEPERRDAPTGRTSAVEKLLVDFDPTVDELVLVDSDATIDERVLESFVLDVLADTTDHEEVVVTASPTILTVWTFGTSVLLVVWLLSAILVVLLDVESMYVVTKEAARVDDEVDGDDVEV